MTYVQRHYIVCMYVHTNVYVQCAECNNEDRRERRRTGYAHRSKLSKSSKFSQDSLITQFKNSLKITPLLNLQRKKMTAVSKKKSDD